MSNWTSLIPCFPLFGIALFVFWKLVRCQHAWDLVDKTELPPPIVAYTERGGRNLHMYSLTPQQIFEMSQRTIILAMRCNKCGHAKIYKERG